MKLSNTAAFTNRNKNNSSQPYFKGAEVFTQALNFLQTNQAMGATFVDAAFMCTPRTIVDFSRGPDAGLETARREFSTNFNDAALGAYGMLAALIFSGGINKKYGIKANKLFVDDDTLETITKIKNKYGNLNDDKNLKNCLNEIVGEMKGLTNKGWVGVKGSKDKIVTRFFETLKPDEKISEKELLKSLKQYVNTLFVGETGVEQEVKIGNCKTKTNLDETTGNIYKTLKVFMNDKVSETFKASKNISDNKFIKSIKGLNKKTTLLGLALCAAVSASVQPINTLLTKKKTGDAGFVGGGEEDKSANFKLLKAGAATLGGLGMFATIGTSISKIMKNVQFKGLCPTLNQFKLVYGINVLARLLSARNKNELRETSIRDSLGFTNWLIFGGFVSKLAAAGFSKLPQFKNDGLIRYNKAEHGKGWFNWITKSSVISRKEALITGFKKAGKEITETIDGKEVALSFKELLKKAPKNVKTKMLFLALAQLSGYLYSGLVLGIGIPKLNIAITKAVEKKKHKNAGLEENNQKNQEVNASEQNVKILNQKLQIAS